MSVQSRKSSHKSSGRTHFFDDSLLSEDETFLESEQHIDELKSNEMGVLVDEEVENELLGDNEQSNINIVEEYDDDDFNTEETSQMEVKSGVDEATVDSETEEDLCEPDTGYEETFFYERQASDEEIILHDDDDADDKTEVSKCPIQTCRSGNEPDICPDSVENIEKDDQSTLEEALIQRHFEDEIGFPRAFIGPCFDKCMYAYSVHVSPVPHNDLSKIGFLDIADAATSIRFIQKASYREIAMYTTKERIGRLMKKVLFGPFQTNDLRIAFVQRAPDTFISSCDPESKDSVAYTYTEQVKVLLQVKSVFIRRAMREPPDNMHSLPTGNVVKSNSLFLHNLPRSVDEELLRMLFPCALRVRVVDVSTHIRSAVIQMANRDMAYKHLIVIPKLMVNDQKVTMSIQDMSQEEAVADFTEVDSVFVHPNVNKPGRKPAGPWKDAKKERKPGVGLAIDAQRKEVEKMFDSISASDGASKKEAVKGKPAARPARKDESRSRPKERYAEVKRERGYVRENRTEQDSEHRRYGQKRSEHKDGYHHSRLSVGVPAEQEMRKRPDQFPQRRKFDFYQDQTRRMAGERGRGDRLHGAELGIHHQELEVWRRRELQYQREIEISRQMEVQRELELHRQQEIELQHQREFELQHQRELVFQQQQELELRQRRDLELQHQREMEEKQQRQLEVQREFKRQQQRDQEFRHQQELEMEKRHDLELRRKERALNAELDQRKFLEAERTVRLVNQGHQRRPLEVTHSPHSIEHDEIRPERENKRRYNDIQRSGFKRSRFEMATDISSQHLWNRDEAERPGGSKPFSNVRGRGILGPVPSEPPQDQMHNVGRRSADFQPRRPNFERDRPALDTDLNQHFSRQAAGDSWVRMSEEDEFDWSQRRAVGRADYNLLRSDGSGDGGGDRFRQVMAKGDRVGGKVSRNDSSEEVYAGNNMLSSYRYHKDSRNWDLEPGTQMSFDDGIGTSQQTNRSDNYGNINYGDLRPSLDNRGLDYTLGSGSVGSRRDFY